MRPRSNFIAGWIRGLLANALIVGLYYLTGRFGVSLAIPPGLASPVWFPSGVALLGVLLLGFRVLPGIWIGSMLVNGITFYREDEVQLSTVLVAVAVATGSTMQTALAAWLLKRQMELTRFWDRAFAVFRFIGTVAPVCAIGSTVGNASLIVAGLLPADQFRESWLTWWLGDLVGIFLVVPLSGLLPRVWGPYFQWKRMAEFALFSALLVMTCVTIFSGEFHLGTIRLPLSFGVLPFLIWAAFRFSQQGVALSVLAISLLALSGTVHHFGPFAHLPRDNALLVLQAFVGVLSITGLVLAAALKEHTAAEDGLKRAIIETERLSQTKSEFASIVSHELRTPLTVVKDSIAMVIEGVDGPVTEAQHDSLSLAMSNVDRLVRLIGNVLDFEKMESGRMEIDLELVDLRDTVSEVARFMHLPAVKKDAKLIVELPDAPLVASCDEDKIKEVLLNLIDNSLKFTPSGGRVWIRLKDRVDGLVMEVEDEGVGIPEEEQERVFEIFRRASTSSIVKAGGFGIGLAVCKLIVDLHQGSISVESTPGKGTRFRIFLPKQIDYSDV